MNIPPGDIVIQPLVSDESILLINNLQKLHNFLTVADDNYMEVLGVLSDWLVGWLVFTATGKILNSLKKSLLEGVVVMFCFVLKFQ